MNNIHYFCFIKFIRTFNLYNFFSNLQAGLGGMRVPGPVAPSVYEMAALTQDLDTQVITTKIKEALLANNIGQKVSKIFLALMITI